MYRTINKLFIILTIFFVILSFAICTYATSDIDEEVYDDEIAETLADNTSSTSEENAEKINSALSALAPSSVTSVSNVNSYESANLQLNNILSIILIAIGVLLILFAIAILIRLK